MDYASIKTPNDLKRLNTDDLKGECEYLRSRIVDVVERNGGHLASNLGAVELTVALHYVFDCPNDKIVFDVGHQSYAHKILTGRGEAFDGLRQNDGISGFPKPSESDCDAFGTGHSSTSLSVALGFAEAAKRLNKSYSSVAVIGDGALTGGLAYEALNAIGSEQLPLVIVLNDNKMSISKNVGAMSKYLTRLRVSKKYARIKSEIKRAVSIIPLFGDGALTVLEKGKSLLKRVVLSNKMFEAMGISYYGPFDGHDVKELVNVFSQVKTKDRPVIVHVVTDKGKGLKSATVDPEHSHGISSASAKQSNEFSTVLGEFLTEAAAKDERVTAVTAAMSIGTGLEKFSVDYPERFKDVGIAEEHAVTYCAALAAAGLKPYFAVYSTFLQRAYDEILHDVCIGNYPVTLCVDRAGVVGADGVTHQGVFDLSYLSSMPNMTVMCPTDGNELKSMLEFSLSYNAPLAIRYPKSYTIEREHEPIVYGKWEVVRKAQKSKIYVLCAGGRALDIACEASDEFGLDIEIVNARFVKPLDIQYLQSVNKKGSAVITIEDNIAQGGFGMSVLSYLNEIGNNVKCVCLSHGDKFIDDRDVKSSLAGSGITKENLAGIVKNLNKQKRKANSL
ncbi:MAG: 1-deoxy-D-xylulose-5-phosphate synthase [Clostridiales bacterium]|nr:1-deoxy-D-xylulose-5-phosphate synthase [Clostridiales bacterium]